MKSNNTYAVRITYDLLGKTYKECVQWILNNNPVKYFIVTEEGSLTGKFHLQAYVDLGDSSINTFRVNLRKFINQFKDKEVINKNVKGGNAYYSCKQTDEVLPLKYLSYLCKEDYQPIHNLTEEELEKVMERQKQFLEDRRKKIEERQPAWKRFIEEHKEWLEGADYKTLQTHLTSKYVEWEVSNDKQENEFQTIRNVRTIMLRFSEKFKQEYKDYLRDKILLC